MLHDAVRRKRAIIWLLGDSTLDNKHWFNDEEAAVNGYEAVLKPARSREDVAHHLNKEIVANGLAGEWCCINTAVEEATLGMRGAGRPLLAQDVFCRDHLQPADALVVSCGGNDIALRPTAWTGVRCFPKQTHLACTPRRRISHAISLESRLLSTACSIFTWPLHDR